MVLASPTKRYRIIGSVEADAAVGDLDAVMALHDEVDDDFELVSR